MRRNYILILFALLSINIFGQKKQLFQNILVEGERKEFLDSLKKEKPEYKKISFVNINPENLFNSELLNIVAFETEFDIKKLSLKSQGSNQYIWTGANIDNDGNTIITIFGSYITGLITKGLEIYSLETLKTGEYVICEIDQSEFPSEKCHTSAKKSKNIPPSNGQKDILDDQTRQVTLNSITHECKIRLLVLYTPAASASVSNINNTINLAIAETNQAFVNSSINTEVELVYAEETNYTEFDIETDLDRFMADNDGFMDEVHDLREVYSADICLLLNDDADWCGYSADIPATEDEAFCVVKADGCATGYYSFAHEIGHLLGCRHDTYVDNTNTPFAFGHGFVNVTDRWRTIMAYDNECIASSTHCTRLQFWSNLSITWAGDPMGSNDTENCARVWNENFNLPLAFRQPPVNIYLTNENLTNSIYADVIASQNIEFSNQINISSTMNLNLRFGNTLLIDNPFNAQLGSVFYAIPEAITNCGSTKK